MLVCDASEMERFANGTNVGCLSCKNAKEYAKSGLGLTNPVFSCMCLSLCSDDKPSNNMGNHKTCMGISNLSMLTLNNTRGMGTPKGLCNGEGVPSLCCVSGYCGVKLAYS